MSNIKWHPTYITRPHRESLNGHKGACLWFTGLSGSGKSTLANEVEALLHAKGIHTYLLDGDNIRHGLNKNLDFSEEGRRENVRRITELAKLFVDAGIVVLTAFISPYRQDRALAREIINSGISKESYSISSFIEIFVECDLQTCEARDPKGLYKKARTGEIKDFTGISSPYEKPIDPELSINNGADSNLKNNAEQVIKYLKENNII